MSEQPGASPDMYLQLLSLRRPAPTQVQGEKVSELRLRLLSLMVGNPESEWTAESLAAHLPWATNDDQDASKGRIRDVHDVVTTLLGDQWAEPVPYQRQLTVRLTTQGVTQLRLLLAAWQADSEEGAKNA
jgi:hypothetical protein